MRIQVFSPMFDSFNKDVLETINSGSANMISLISPLMMTGFSIYVLLIGLSYWNGATSIGVGDMAKRLIGWAVIITCGMNIQYYSEYVVPFFNGIGDDIAAALTHTPQTSQALDALVNSYVGAVAGFFSRITSPVQVVEALEAVMLTLVLALVAIPFLGIAAAYIILAKFALGILLALGPLFISLALFPATRRFFDAWVSQAISYALLVALFAAVAALEVGYATSQVTLLSSSASCEGADCVKYLQAVFSELLMGVVFIVVSLNMPSLASQLSGGVGISSMVGKLGMAAGGAAALTRKVKGASRSTNPAGGGSMKHEAT